MEIINSRRVERFLQFVRQVEERAADGAVLKAAKCLIINPTHLPKARLIILLEVGINNDQTVALFHTPFEWRELPPQPF